MPLSEMGKLYSLSLEASVTAGLYSSLSALIKLLVKVI